MGLFDFLKPTQTFKPGASAPMVMPGELKPQGPSDGLLSAEGMQPAERGPSQVMGMTQAPTEGPKMGFLDKIKDPGSDGISFVDRLYAAGGLAAGDPNGGMPYLQGIKDRQAKDQITQLQLGDRQKRSAAFKAAMMTGKFDPSIYAQMAEDALDPGDLASLQGSLKPRTQFLQGPNGQVSLGDLDTGEVAEKIKGGQRIVNGYIQDPETQQWSYAPGGPHDPQVIAREALARRRVVVDNPVARRGGGRSGGKPKSYSVDDVTF